MGTAWPGLVFALALGPAAAFADAGQLADTLGIWRGAVLSAADRRTVAAELEVRTALKPDNQAILTPVLVSLAELGEKAARPAARLLMRDLYREVLTEMAGPRADALMQAADPLVRSEGPGLGLAASDIAASAWLEHAAGKVARTLDEAAPPRDFAAASRAALLTLYDGSDPVNRQFLSRLDAWAAGLRAAWPDLSAEDRRIAASVTIADDMPSPDLLARITGSPDLQAWLAAVDPGLTGPEAATHPELADLLERGVLAGPALDLLAARMTGVVALAVEFNTLTLMRQLNFYQMRGDEPDISEAARAMELK